MEHEKILNVKSTLHQNGIFFKASFTCLLWPHGGNKIDILSTFKVVMLNMLAVLHTEQYYHSFGVVSLAT